MKGSQLFSDYDIYIKILAPALNIDEDEAKEMIQRNRAQKMEELKMAIIGQNPEALKLVPMQADQGTQIGTGEGGPNPMLSPPEQGQQPPPEGEQPPEQNQEQSPEGEGPKPAPSPKANAMKLPKPSGEDIKKYDLDITGSKYMDSEESDLGEIS